MGNNGTGNGISTVNEYPPLLKVPPIFLLNRPFFKDNDMKIGDTFKERRLFKTDVCRAAYFLSSFYSSASAA